MPTSRRATASIVICLSLFVQSASAEQESTSAPTIDLTDHQTDSASSASCKNLVLADGTEITIDSEAACERACTLHLWSLDSYNFWQSWGHVHFQYTSFEPVYHEDGSIDERLIDAVGGCSCLYDYDDRILPLCGPTEYRLQLPEKPLPLCGDIGVEYSSACPSKCSSLYPSDSNMYYDWWSEWSRGRYRGSCTCILNDVISVEICNGFGPNSYPSGSYNYNNDEENDITSIFPLLIILAVLGIGGCICVAKKSSNEQHQELSQYRQQQQQRRQEASASTNNAGQPTEEELVARGDVVRSNLFSHTLSEDDDLKNLTSILIASSSNGTTNREGERETISSGNGAGLLETLRSAISTNRSSVSANKVECSICLMGYAAGETVSWAKEEGCDHAYHQQCIVGWLSTAKRDGTLHDSCPLCRTKLITETNAAEA